MIRTKDARLIRAGITDAKATIAKALTISRGELRVRRYEGIYGDAHWRTLRREMGKHINSGRLTYALSDTQMHIRRGPNAATAQPVRPNG